jgi:hypothetical protein
MNGGLKEEMSERRWPHRVGIKRKEEEAKEGTKERSKTTRSEGVWEQKDEG